MIAIDGRGLHTGAPARVTFEATAGATTIAAGGIVRAIEALTLTGGDRATRARWAEGVEVETIEHLLAAVVGLGAFEGVAIAIEGPEVPLVDGAARAFAAAMIDVLGAPRDAPATGWRVTAATTIAIGEATYRWAPAETIALEARVDYPAARFGRALAGAARWGGDRAHFLEEIATARTFGAARELDALRAAGRAAFVPEGSVVALDVDDARWAPRDAGEPIRHKLLDLMGDLAALGAPLVGALVAARPSHRATQGAIAEARARGVLVRDRRR